MILPRYTAKFIRMYKGLEPTLKEEVMEKISLFQDEKNHSLLKVHKLHGGFKNYYSFSNNYQIRIIFKYENKNTVNLLYIGDHDELYR